MKIINIIGGLGNQMFQFALYLSLKNRFPEEEIKIYTGAFNGYKKHNAYELDYVFDISASRATNSEVIRMAYPCFNYRLWQVCHHLLPQRKTMFKERIFGRYEEKALQKEGNCFYDGYWQSEKYFEDIQSKIISTFTTRNIDEHNLLVGRQVATSESVSIHVRHGDFVSNPIYQGLCQLDYYQRAIEYILTSIKVDIFCIFSNDINWSKEQIVPLLKGTKHLIIDWNQREKSYLDMYLMSQCHHNIIANSSFSWWGAWLNQHPGKTVICPKKWNNLRNSEFKTPFAWICL